MAIVIGLIVGLFLLLGFHLLGFGLRNPRWLFVAFCLILALYKYGREQLESNSMNVSVTAQYSIGCDAGHVEVTISNKGAQHVRRLGFELNAFRPNHSGSVAKRFHRTDRIIPADQSWTSCWRVLQLDNVPADQHTSLRWDVRISSISLGD